MLTFSWEKVESRKEIGLSTSLFGTLNFVDAAFKPLTTVKLYRTFILLSVFPVNYCSIVLDRDPRWNSLVVVQGSTRLTIELMDIRSA